MLAGTAGETVSARTALHARTGAKMARKARSSFWLSSDLYGPKIESHASPIKRNVTPLWVISGHFGQEVLCPLYPPKVDMNCLFANARKGQKQTVLRTCDLTSWETAQGIV